MYQAKIFSGCSKSIEGNAISADDKFNEWIQEHQSIEIVDFVYQQSGYENHSIAILYKERTKNSSNKNLKGSNRVTIPGFRRKDSE